MKRIGEALCFIREQGPQGCLTEDNQSIQSLSTYCTLKN